MPFIPSKYRKYAKKTVVFWTRSIMLSSTLAQKFRHVGLAHSRSNMIAYAAPP
jgi:hypothetical protein